MKGEEEDGREIGRVGEWESGRVGESVSHAACLTAGKLPDCMTTRPHNLPTGRQAARLHDCPTA